MAIAPIDLQTLFTQVDKVGRAQVAQREGQALQQAIQGVEIQRKTEENIKQVNEAQNTGEGTDKINDQSQRQGSDSKKDGKKKDGSQHNEEAEEHLSVLRDPYLGKKIDISL